MGKPYLSPSLARPISLARPLPRASRQQEVAAASSGAATHLCACLAAASRWQGRG